MRKFFKLVFFLGILLPMAFCFPSSNKSPSEDNDKKHYSFFNRKRQKYSYPAHLEMEGVQKVEQKPYAAELDQFLIQDNEGYTAYNDDSQIDYIDIPNKKLVDEPFKDTYTDESLKSSGSSIISKSSRFSKSSISSKLKAKFPKFRSKSATINEEPEKEGDYLLVLSETLEEIFADLIPLYQSEFLKSLLGRFNSFQRKTLIHLIDSHYFTKKSISVNKVAIFSTVHRIMQFLNCSPSSHAYRYEDDRKLGIMHRFMCSASGVLIYSLQEIIDDVVWIVMNDYLLATYVNLPLPIRTFFNVKYDIPVRLKNFINESICRIDANDKSKILCSSLASFSCEDILAYNKNIPILEPLRKKINYNNRDDFVDLKKLPKKTLSKMSAKEKNYHELRLLFLETHESFVNAVLCSLIKGINTSGDCRVKTMSFLKCDDYPTFVHRL